MPPSCACRTKQKPRCPSCSLHSRGQRSHWMRPSSRRCHHCPSTTPAWTLSRWNMVIALPSHCVDLSQHRHSTGTALVSRLAKLQTEAFQFIAKESSAMMKDASVKRQMKRTGIAKDAVLDLACDI